MTFWQWLGVIALIVLQGLLIYQARVWYHRQWLERFRRHKAFRELPPGFTDSRDTRTSYPQDHPQGRR